MRLLIFAFFNKTRLLGHFVNAAVLLAGLLALAACGTSGSSRECSFARPLVLSHKSIAGLDPDDARAVLAYDRQVQAVCGR